MARAPSTLEILTEKRGLAELRRHALDREIAELDERIGALRAEAERRLPAPDPDEPPTDPERVAEHVAEIKSLIAKEEHMDPIPILMGTSIAGDVAACDVPAGKEAGGAR